MPGRQAGRPCRKFADIGAMLEAAEQGRAGSQSQDERSGRNHNKPEFGELLPQMRLEGQPIRR
jgi:hypothetical protein